MSDERALTSEEQVLFGRAARRSAQTVGEIPSEQEVEVVARASGIYVASRASVPERSAMWRGHRAAGVPIVSSWIDEAGAGDTNDFGDLWERIRREVTGAAGVVAYLEPEDFPVRGVFIEIGMALAAGVPVFVVAPDVALEGRSMRPLGSWLYHPLVRQCATVEEAFGSILSALSSLRGATYSQAEWDEAGQIGERDGYEKAVQDIDLLTGGEGEYRFCTDGDPDRHTPDVETMKARIVARFESLRGGVGGNSSSSADGAAVPKSSAPSFLASLEGERRPSRAMIAAVINAWDDSLNPGSLAYEDIERRLDLAIAKAVQS